jgi:hypothetical protein
VSGENDPAAAEKPADRFAWERQMINAGLPHDLLLVAMVLATLRTGWSANLEVSDELLCPCWATRTSTSRTG